MSAGTVQFLHNFLNEYVCNLYKISTFEFMFNLHCTMLYKFIEYLCFVNVYFVVGVIFNYLLLYM